MAKEKDEENDPSEPSQHDIAIDAIQNFILERYAPADSFKDSQVNLTTYQIFSQIVALYPSELYTEADLFHFLTDNGFKFDTISDDMKFVWLLKQK